MNHIAERYRVIAKVYVQPEATPEQLLAIKTMIERAGLISEVDGREIRILEVDDGSHIGTHF